MDPLSTTKTSKQPGGRVCWFNEARHCRDDAFFVQRRDDNGYERCIILSLLRQRRHHLRSQHVGLQRAAVLLQILYIAVEGRAVIGYLPILERGFDFVDAVLQRLANR